MYEAHFGLREPPFGMTPDTSYAYACTAHQEALNTLLIAVKNGEGFIKVTGEVGVGKTLLCRRFLATLDASCVSAYLPNPLLEPRALLLSIADELGLALPRYALQQQLLCELNAKLLALATEGRTVVLCLDEAQAIPIETLEALRLLTNLETEKRKLLQVVLFAQPELDATLDQPAVRQLRQRIVFQHRLLPLEREEVEHYLAHRLRVAGYRGPGAFTARAVRVIHAASRGVPRLVNILAHKGMLLAYGEGQSQVAPRHVLTAIRDTPAARQPRRWLWFALAVTACTLGGAGWMFHP